MADNTAAGDVLASLRSVVTGDAAATGCLTVAEISQTHDGSLGQAHAFIDAVARTGADAVKFQTHIAAAESTPAEPWRIPFSRQDASRYDYWRRMEFTEEQWAGLADHAREVGLAFLSSAFSEAAIELLEGLDLRAWKVASGEVGNLPLLRRMAKGGAPVLLSSGMSALDELDAAVETVRAAGAPVAVLQCATAYPCPPEQVGLNVIGELRERYGCWVGLSDHSATIFPSIAAATLRADVVEVHVTMSREMFGPDVPASVTTAELAELVRGVRFVEQALANPVDKDQVAAAMAPMRELFTRSVVAAVDIPAGTRLAETDLIAKKPGTGIPAARIPELVGRVTRRAIAADTLLTDDDLEPSR
jgi:N-acetylneuraminate synthase